MTDFIYLTYEQVVALNTRHCGVGAGVRDEGGIRAQLGRAEASFGGTDLHPTVWDKAAVILHGLSSTQYFHDGNKRTAWLATVLFLGINGVDLRDLSDVEAEAFVLSIATKAFESEDDPERGITKAAEWFREIRLRMSDRLDYAILARAGSFSEEDSDTFDLTTGQIGGVAAPDFPFLFPLAAIVRTAFRAEDVYLSWMLRAHAVSDTGVAEIVGPSPGVLAHLQTHSALPYWFDPIRDTVPYQEEIALAFENIRGHPDHAGATPSLSVMQLALKLNHPGRAFIVFTINGEFLARRMLEVGHAPELSADTNIDGALARLLREG